jgi:ABC-2 type transport system permease protein
MSKVGLVFKNEFITTVTRKSFWLVLLLVPLIGLGGTFVLGRIGGEKIEETVENVFTSEDKNMVVGLVDEVDLIKEIPENSEETFVVVESLDQGLVMMAAGEINAFYLIPSDYYQTGKIKYYQENFTPGSDLENSYWLRYWVNYNLLDGNDMLASRLENPFYVEAEITAEEPQRDPDSALTFFLPYVVTFLFYIIILGSASLMLNSVASEKQNRVIEILMTSITPMQMMTGKILALGLVGLLQTVVWSGTGLAVLRLSGRTLGLSEAFQLPFSVLLWGILFFILGYAVYASLMAGLGALVPNMREASQATFVVILPLIIPIMLISALIEAPNSGISVALSMIPFTAPIAMMTRLSATQVPFWQPVLAALLLVGTAFLVLRSVSGMFRAQNLLSGKEFSVKVFFKSLIGKY